MTLCDNNPPIPNQTLLSILTRARVLQHRVARAISGPDQFDPQFKALLLLSERLNKSVILPFEEAVAELRATDKSEESEFGASERSDAGAADLAPVLSLIGLGDDLWALTKDATTLQVMNETASEMREHRDIIRYGLMGCFLHVRAMELTDDAARMAM